MVDARCRDVACYVSTPQIPVNNREIWGGGICLIINELTISYHCLLSKFTITGKDKKYFVTLLGFCNISETSLL